MNRLRFIDETIYRYEKELLFILISTLGVARWWIPQLSSSLLSYSASQWILSYDHGFIRRGLIGTIIESWNPVVTLPGVYHIALIAYCILLISVLWLLFALFKRKGGDGTLFKLILFFIFNPATLSFLAQDLGRFDLFLIMISILCLTTISKDKFLWLIPPLMIVAMLIHEAFLVLFAPTILAAIIFIHLLEHHGKTILAVFILSVIALLGSFFLLRIYGTPTVGFKELFTAIQSRANFTVSDMSVQQCYFSIKDHVKFASSYLYEKSAIISFLLALFMLSPTILVFVNLWANAMKTARRQRLACSLLFMSTLSAFILLPVGIDDGRWLSAFVFCNFFAFYILINKNIIRIEELGEYFSGSFSFFSMLIILTYALFGPLRTVYPYPFKDNFLYSFLSLTSILVCDIGIYLNWYFSGARRTAQQ